MVLSLGNIHISWLSVINDDNLASDSISASQLSPFASLCAAMPVQYFLLTDSPHKLQARIAWTGDIHLLSDPHLVPQVYLDLDNTKLGCLQKIFKFGIGLTPQFAN